LKISLIYLQIGPLFLAPPSEIYGRRVILNISTANFALWQIGCALAPNISSLIIFRLFTGIGGSGCLTIGGGVVSDLFEKQQRGLAMTIFTVGPLLDPVLGPLCGGFIGQRAGWRWVEMGMRTQNIESVERQMLTVVQIFWILLIAGGAVTTALFIFLRETNPVILIQRKTHRLRKELNRSDLHSCFEIINKSRNRTKATILLSGIIRPTKMLIFSPIVAILGLYIAVIYGLLYLLFTTVTFVFSNTYG
jgi:MFS family permease